MTTLGDKERQAILLKRQEILDKINRQKQQEVDVVQMQPVNQNNNYDLLAQIRQAYETDNDSQYAYQQPMIKLNTLNDQQSYQTSASTNKDSTKSFREKSQTTRSSNNYLSKIQSKFGPNSPTKQTQSQYDSNNFTSSYSQVQNVQQQMPMNMKQQNFSRNMCKSISISQQSNVQNHSAKKQVSRQNMGSLSSRVQTARTISRVCSPRKNIEKSTPFQETPIVKINHNFDEVSKIKESLQSFNKRLEQAQMQKLNKIEKLKKSKLDQEDNQCTFKPEIKQYKSQQVHNHKQNTLSNSQSQKDIDNFGVKNLQQSDNNFNEYNDDQNQQHQSAYDRLQNDALIRKFKEEKRRREIEQERLKECTFKPKTIDYKQVVSYSNIQSQYKNDQQKKKVESLQIYNALNNEQNQDRPIINDKSRRLVQEKLHGNIKQQPYERLYNHANQQVDRKANQQFNGYKQSIQHSMDSQSFTQIDNLTQEEKEMIFQEFLNRQQQFLDNKTQNLEKTQVQQQLSKICSYEPQINQVSKILGTQYNEENRDVYNRLYQHGKLGNLNQNSSQTLSNYNEPVQFRPQINQTSKLIAQSRDSYFELTNYENINRLNQKQQDYAETRMKEYTFQPKINQVYQVQSNFSAIIEDAQSHQIKKDLWQHQQQTFKTMDEFRDCTFTPQINQQTLYNQDPDVKVKGLERYFELKDLQRRQQQELELRKKEVFRDGSQYGMSSKDKITQECQAPNLKTMQRAQIKKQSSYGSQNNLASQYTFIPMTNNYQLNMDIENELKNSNY
eukprot:403359047